MSFLLIENRTKTKPSINLLSTLGASDSRDRYESIGMFGTGTLNAIAILVRENLHEGTKICLGNDVYTIVPKIEETQSARGNVNEIVRIFLKKQNGGLIDLNITSGFGIKDWTNPGMALREFISNAIDGQTDYDGKPQKVRIEVIDNDRASKDYVRVYIPMSREVEKYVDNLKKNFLMFRFNYNPKQTILPKDEPGPARLYRKGVFVGEFGINSLYDYNIDNLELKECRIVDSYEAERKAAIALMTNKSGKLKKFFQTEGFWEHEINTYYFNPSSYYSYSDFDEIKTNFSKNFVEALGTNVVACRNSQEALVLSNKGYVPKIINSTEIYTGLKNIGAPVIEKVLSENDREGRVIVDAMSEHIRSLDEVWSMVVSLGLSANKEKPSLKSFRRVEQYDGRDAYAVYVFNDKEILMNAAYTSGTTLIHSLLHELGHHITESLDGSLPM